MESSSRKTVPVKPTNAAERSHDRSFNPYGLHSIHIPLGMLKCSALSWGAKCLYGRLALFRGSKSDGFCNPDLNMMAGSMGVSVDTVDRWLKELIDEGFILRIRQRRRRAECIFLRHRCLVNSGPMDGPGKEDSSQNPDSAMSRNPEAALDSAGLRSQDVLDSVDLPTRFRNSAVLDSANLPPPYIGIKHSGENIHENVQSSSSPETSAIVDEPLMAELVDDDSLAEMKNENPVREALLAFINGARFPLPSGRIPDEIIAATLRELSAGIEDLVRFLKEYHGRLTHGPPATWGHVVIAFQRWAADPRTLDYIRMQRALLAEQQRREAYEEETRRRMETPTDPESAMQLAEIEEARIPDILRRRLIRLGDFVSPATVLTFVREWRKCRDCQDSGYRGNALAKTLAFCDCLAGEEQRLTDGADQPEREIARVHATLQSRMVAAAHDCDLHFAADAIERSSIIDDGKVLRIITRKEDSAFVAPREIQRVLEVLGECRVVEIAGKKTPAPETSPRLTDTPSAGPRRIIDSATCSKCKEQIVAYSDRTIEGCACGNCSKIGPAREMPSNMTTSGVAG